MRPILEKELLKLPPDLVVLKFGGSVLRDADAVHLAAHEVYRSIRRGEKVIAVVSALAGETDALMALAQDTGGSADVPGCAELLRLGEMRTAALLALALGRAGVDARALDPAQIGLRAGGPAGDAALVDLDKAALADLLEAHDVLVVPGFSGVLDDGRAAVLGRGGSDMSAVFLADALGAKDLRLIKDVDGLYAADPKGDGVPRRFGALNWQDAAVMCGPSIQRRALDHARDRGLHMQIAAPARRHATSIGPGQASRYASLQTRRLKVALLGFGTVGEGVYAHVQRHGDLFEVCGILVQDAAKARGPQAPRHLISDDPAQVLGTRPDIIVEMIGGVDAAQAFILNAFFGGADVVSANKAVLASRFCLLHKAARQAGRSLRYSAAVGGGVPMLEALDQARKTQEIVSVQGVINGTANFILGRLAQGCTFEAAVAGAQQCGFAEADPSADLDGLDAAAKLVLMARHGFGATLRQSSITCESLRDLDPARLAAARQQGRVIRQVSEISRNGQGKVRASVSLQALPSGHYLAAAKGEHNRLVITLKNGQTLVLRGKGAGRWPTAEAVMADLLDIHRLRGQYESRASTGMPEPVCA